MLPLESPSPPKWPVAEVVAEPHALRPSRPPLNPLNPLVRPVEPDAIRLDFRDRPFP